MITPALKSFRYWLRLLGFFGVALVVVYAGVPIWLGASFTRSLLYSPCSGGYDTPANYGYAWEEVTLPARAGGSFRGYFLPGSTGAAIIIPPTGSDGRDNQLPKAAMLLEHGYSVFTFESRRCAGQGPLSLGYKEVSEVADAVDYLSTRPEVDPTRLGIWGFSTAGATAIMAAARLPALRAVVAEGGYGDFLEDGLGSRGDRSGGPATYLFLTVYRWSTIVTYYLMTGLDIRRLSPVRVIDGIAPRPILLIYGSEEHSLAGGRRQKAAAGENVELWIVPGAGHGNYREVAPEDYRSRVLSFFDETLKY